VIERSETRKKLEESVRALLPLEEGNGNGLTGSSSSVATAGVGGLLAGYVWGFLRGRRSKRRKS
jgi:hypothetical protein